DLRQRERAMQAELQSIATQTQDRAAYLRLAETLSAFLSRLRSTAKTLDIAERQRIVRLLVKEGIVSEDAITIRHSVPVPSPPRDDGTRKPGKSNVSKGQSDFLRSGRRDTALRRAALVPLPANNPPLPVAIPFLDRRFQPQLDQPQHRAVRDATSYRLEQIVMRNRIEVAGQISVHNIGVAPA